jgi:hypothetical protein
MSRRWREEGDRDDAEAPYGPAEPVGEAVK